MAFKAPVEQQLFALRHFAQIHELANEDRYSELSPDLVEAIVGEVGKLAENEWAPLNRVGDENPSRLENGKVVMAEGFQAAWDAYIEGGWAGLSAPADYGGQGLPFSLGLLAIESLGTANMAFGLCPTLTFGAIEALAEHGSQQQKSLYLPKLSSGEWTGTMNLTEPGAGSDVGALKTIATPVGDGTYKISGQKIFITYGDHELVENIIHLVLARTPDGPAGTKGISLFLVPKYRLDENGEPGESNNVVPLKVEHKMGIHASPTCVLQFGEGGDTIGELIGPEFGGMKAMFTMMNNARVNVGNQGVQISERALQQALSYAADRVQSARASDPGKGPAAIVGHPDVRRMLMRMKAGTEAIRALNFYTAGMIDRGSLGDEAASKRADLLVPMLKAYSTDMGCEITSLNIQVHGGMGYIEETGAAQLYRDARIAPIYEGTNGIQAMDLVGRKLNMDGGAVIRGLIAEIAKAAEEAGSDGETLSTLADTASQIVDWMTSEASIDDKLAGSVSFCTLLSVLACGWLMLRQLQIAQNGLEAGEGDADFLKAREAVARYYLAHMVPEAMGLATSAKGGAALLYTLDADNLTV